MSVLPTPPGATPEIMQVFEAFYLKHMEKHAGGTDEGELKALNNLIREAQSGVTPVEGGTIHINPSHRLDATDPKTIQALTGTQGDINMRQRVIIAVVATIIACIGSIVWVSLQGGFGGGGISSAQVATATPTLLPTPIIESVDSLIESSGVSLTSYYPVTLVIGDRTYVVYPVEISRGDWSPPPGSETVSWINGTITNYVMGLLFDDGNKYLLENLTYDDPIELRLSSGVVLKYRFAARSRVSRNANEIFSQQEPGMTIVLLNEPDAEDRLVVSAAYDVTNELTTSSDLRGIQADAEIGQQAKTEDAIVLIQNVQQKRVLDDYPLPEESIAYIVTATIQNVRETPLVLELMSMELTNGSDRFLPAPNIPDTDLPQGTLETGEQITLHLGYLLSFSNNENVAWTIETSEGQEIVFELPSPELITVDDSPSLLASVYNAYEAGGLMAVHGMVINVSDAAETILFEDISATMNGDAVSIVPQAPVGGIPASILPATIQADETWQFTFYFSPPSPGGEITISVRDQSFVVRRAQATTTTGTQYGF
jgi:hypothetical protein